MEKGAKDVTACATHAVLSGPAIERIRNSAIKELVLLDNHSTAGGKDASELYRFAGGPLFAEAIERIYEDKPVSPMFV